MLFPLWRSTALPLHELPGEVIDPGRFLPVLLIPQRDDLAAHVRDEIPLLRQLALDEQAGAELVIRLVRAGGPVDDGVRRTAEGLARIDRLVLRERDEVPLGVQMPKGNQPLAEQADV